MYNYVFNPTDAKEMMPNWSAGSNLRMKEQHE